MVTLDRRRMLTLEDLLSAVPGARLVKGDPSRPITGVSHDTRCLRDGELFVAIKGFRYDGLDFVGEALARGASAVVAESVPVDSDAAPLVLVPSARAALADLAAAFHGHPSRLLSVVGITGTDGKTTTAHLLSGILEARGLKTGWLSTVNTKVRDRLRSNASEHTTPEAPVLQGTLGEMASTGVDVAILEASSHALKLDRVRGTYFKVGVFTNLSPEHINFHGTFAAYRDAKTQLFASLPSDGLAVLNADDPNSSVMRAATRAPVVTYGLDNAADVRATDISVSPEGTSFVVADTRDGLSGGSRDTAVSVRLRTQLVGEFNVSNWLAAYCAATYFGASIDDLCRATERQGPVPGRMNLLRRGQPFVVVVDFAHTRQGLENALDGVRRLTGGRVLLMFGLPGGRDFHNRPAIGQLAVEKSDFLVVTTEDPFDEDPAEIAEQIASGARAAGGVEGRDFIVDLDRRAALRKVLRAAGDGDAVLLAGHGHLKHLVIGARKLPWNDEEVAAEELLALGYGGS